MYLIYLKSKNKLGVNKNVRCIIWKNCFLYRLAFIALCKTFSLNKDINQKSFCLISFPGVKFEMFKNGPSNDTELFRLRINMVFKEYTFLRIHSLLENTKKYSPFKFFLNLFSQCVKRILSKLRNDISGFSIESLINFTKADFQKNSYYLEKKNFPRNFWNYFSSTNLFL